MTEVVKEVSALSLAVLVLYLVNTIHFPQMVWLNTA